MKYTGFVLKVMVATVAISRYAGAFALSAGFVAEGKWHTYLGIAEVVAGISMAVLEGFAIAFILNKWRLLKVNSVGWWGLLIVCLLLALSMPLIAVPYLYFYQAGFGAVSEIFPHIVVQLGWNFVIAGVPMLVIIGVGLADVNELEREQKRIDFELETSKKRAQLEIDLSYLELEIEQAKATNNLEIKRLRATHKVELSQIEARVEQDSNKAFVCEYCGKGHERQSQLSGHLGQCKARKNGQQMIESTKIGEQIK